MRLTEVQLDVDRTGSLEARLLLAGSFGQHTVLAHGLDGLVLAAVLGVPMTMIQQSAQLAEQHIRGMPTSSLPSERPTMDDGVSPGIRGPWLARP